MKDDNTNAWESIANACIDRAFQLFKGLDERPENFDQMAGLVRLAIDIDAHTKSSHQEE